MSRITGCFQNLRSNGRKALIPYITAGDPQPGVTVPLLHALVEAGADLLEIGVPFSDPMADGPVIQAACERALVHGVSLHRVLDMVREFRQENQVTPVVLMGYLNPIEAWGYKDFARAASDAGVDGVLTVDLPPEEAGVLKEVLQEQDLDMIFLLAPTSGKERIRRISAMASGFLYYVSLKGVTGAKKLDIAAVAAGLAEIRPETALPLGVGFGIHDAESAVRVAEIADAVVVGSALVSRIPALQDTPDLIPGKLALTVSEMRRAIDGIRSERTGMQA
jgi:tryptophan synthase alpha chain